MFLKQLYIKNESTPLRFATHNFMKNAMLTRAKSYVILISLVSALGGFLFGYDWVVIGGAKPFYEQFFYIANSPTLQGWAMSIAILGCLLGASIAGILADKFGRKKLLFFAGILFTISAYLTGESNGFTIFLVARFIGGVGIGVTSDISPMYIAEVAPKKIRGRLVSLNQLTIVIGILSAQIVNWLIAKPIPETFSSIDILNSWNGQYAWRWMFWAELFPSFLFLIALFFIPESPKWLILKGYTSKAQSILSKIGGKKYAEDEIKLVANSISNNEKNGLKILFSKPMRKVLILGVVIAIFQQWSGTNVIFNYAQEIFQSAGFALSDVLFNIVVTGIANLVFTFVAIFMVDKIGRKALLLIGAGGLSAIYFLLGTSYYLEINGWLMVTLVVLAIAFYAMSLGPIAWVIISEIFPNKIRGIGMAIATLALWIGCFTLTYTFPILNSAFKSSGTFWLYAIICALGFIYILKKLPETKGKSLEELENELVKK